MALRNVIQDAPYTNAVLWTESATNADLMRHTLQAARAAWPMIDWPKELPKRDAGKLAHEFARSQVQYVREDGDQLTRMPWRTIEDGRGDCKSLSVLVASLARAAGRDTVLRFARYPGEDHFGHVYAVVDGVPCDPELTYGDEVTADEYKDRRI